MSKTLKLLSSVESIELCAQLLREGNLVAVPTETVYGLAGNALSESAARKIFAAKGRPLIDPLITHFHQLGDVYAHIQETPNLEKIAKAFWPGPLTVIVKKKASIPDIITAGMDSVAIRLPSHPIFREILKSVEFPLAAPSANPFSYVSPTTAEHVLDGLEGKISAVVDAGPTEIGVESTILDLRNQDTLRILRPGPISLDQIESATGIPVLKHENNVHSKIEAPGMLNKHYSPSTKLDTFPNGSPSPNFGQGTESHTAVIFQKRPERIDGKVDHYWLSEDGDIGTVAQNLFRLIRSLDKENYDQIHVELAANGGIGDAVNDRLGRAAQKNQS